MAPDVRSLVTMETDKSVSRDGEYRRGRHPAPPSCVSGDPTAIADDTRGRESVVWSDIARSIFSPFHRIRGRITPVRFLFCVINYNSGMRVVVSIDPLEGRNRNSNLLPALVHCACRGV